MPIRIKEIKYKEEIQKDSNKGGFHDMKHESNFQFGLRRFSNKNKHQFFSDLSMLLSSGIDIVNCFEIAEENFSKKKDKEIIWQIRRELEQGSSLSIALKLTNLFSPYEYYSVEIGEETGTLNVVVANLVEFHQRNIEQKRKLVSALSYPLMVLVTALGALGFMLGFVVPMFKDIFQRSGRTLPWITQYVVDLSELIGDNLYLILFGFSMIIIIFVFLSRQYWFKKYVSIFLLKVPFFGGLIRRIYLLRFCTAFELLSKAHMPLIESLTLLEKMISFYPLSSTLSGIIINIQHGHSLSESLEDHSIYDSRLRSLVKVAEQVNLLGEIFSTLKDQYTEEVNYKTSMMGSVLEPILIIFVGLIVGVVLVSMYLPIFEFSSSSGL